MRDELLTPGMSERVKALAADAKARVPLRRAAAELAEGLAGVAAAVFAWLACAGMPAVLAALGAIGARSIAAHAYMFPAYAAFMGFSVWLLWRSGRPRGELRPFWLGALGAAFAVGTTWLALLGLAAPSLALWSYAGAAGVVAASAWTFLLSRRPGSCLREVAGEAQLRVRRGSPARRLVTAAVVASLITVTLYGMYWSVRAAGAG